MENVHAPLERNQVHYLTVQDMIWINTQVTKQVQAFDFATLEEATYFQYGYGKSLDVLKQAARFLGGFAKQLPFAKGNKATGFVGFVAFLSLNGYGLALPDAEATDWLRRLDSGSINAEDAVAALAKPVPEDQLHHELVPSVADTVIEVLERYPKTIADLSD